MTSNNPISFLGWSNAERLDAFTKWLDSIKDPFAIQVSTLRQASADASFRRYFRIDSALKTHPTLIIMDAPPEQENSQPFVDIAKLMQQAGITVPEILNWDKDNGFMLLSDLGSETILQAIEKQPENAQLAESLMREAIPILVKWQQSSQPAVLPSFDEAVLRRDLSLFSEWYVGKYRQISLSDTQQKVWEQCVNLIVERCLAMPQVYVHRDYMPRNLMVSPSSSVDQPVLGVLDFQDALYGPIAYDIASFMRDAFHSWDESFVLDMTIRYWQAAQAAGLPVQPDFSDFWMDVEWMGLQRHLKVMGIFARLTLRDGKPKYLADTPRFLHYVRETTHRYRELHPLFKLINEIENETPETAFY